MNGVPGTGGCVVLLSGGMDSATCLALASRKDRPVRALTVLYGQRHAREVRAARELARYFEAVEHRVVRLPIRALLRSALTDRRRRLPGPRSAAATARIPSTYVPARNTILLSLALSFAESRRARAIYLGVNAIDYSGYPDCRPEFLAAFRRVARLGTRVGTESGRPIALRAPLLRSSKAQIVRLGERLGVPWGLTWSCYRGGRRPCGMCDACRLRAKGFADAGVVDPGARSKFRAGAEKYRRRSASP